MWAEWRFVLLGCGDGVPIQAGFLAACRWAAGGVGRSRAEGGKRKADDGMMSAKVRFSPASQLLAAWASILAQHTADRQKHHTFCVT